MGISPATVAFLRALGREAKHLHKEGLDRLSDQEILAKARDENQILLTGDLDFGELVVASQSALPSVIIFRLQPPMSANKVNRYLVQVIRKHADDLEKRRSPERKRKVDPHSLFVNIDLSKPTPTSTLPFHCVYHNKARHMHIPFCLRE